MISQANARVADMKEELKELKKKMKETEKRAIMAERHVKKLLKEVDFKEGMPTAYFCISFINIIAAR